MWFVGSFATLGLQERRLSEVGVEDRSDDGSFAISLLLGNSAAVHVGMDGLVGLRLVAEMGRASSAFV